jgi:hypothetical protein
MAISSWYLSVLPCVAFPTGAQSKLRCGSHLVSHPHLVMCTNREGTPQGEPDKYQLLSTNWSFLMQTQKMNMQRQGQVSKTLVLDSTLTGLITQEDF